MDFQGKIAQANGRLKSAKCGVRIQVMGDRLYLRATLPPRSGSRKTIAHQQRLALGFHANAHGLQLAEKAARKVGALLDCGEFSWEPYLNHAESMDTVAAWVARFTHHTPSSDSCPKNSALSFRLIALAWGVVS